MNIFLGDVQACPWFIAVVSEHLMDPTLIFELLGPTNDLVKCSAPVSIKQLFGTLNVFRPIEAP